jgi:phosphoribosylformimino-5-aminoimidazole carboxamide ribotide isomerase
MSQSVSAVVPVLDLMIGQVVLAQAGNRDAYLPVHSRLTHSSRPSDVALAIFNQTGCDWLYLADIDSFAGANPNWLVYNELINRGFGIWVDADWIHDDRCFQITEKIDQPEKLSVILSSETLSSLQQLATFEELIAKKIEPIFSLDQKGGSIITRPGELTDTQPLELVRMAYDRGVRQFIALDLDSVGTMSGFSGGDHGVGALIQEISDELNDACVISGGGVCDASDIQALLDLGCDHVLVASAIHDCKLTPDDVTQLNRKRKNKSV